MNNLTFGRFTLPSYVIAAVASLFISSLIFRIIKKQKIHDGYWNSFILYVVVYKISYAVFHFHLFLVSPLSLLYFNGGIKGAILASISVTIYIFWLFKKGHGQFLHDFLFILISFLFIYEMTFHAFLHYYLSMFIELILLISFLIYNNPKKLIKTGKLKVLWIFILLETLLLSLNNELLYSQNLSLILIGIIILAFTRRTT